jgi:nanoRNase/pAp phosphatase (c-di-AMP/oligoRNAs hydrolase)
LHEQSLVPSTAMATALIYALRTETQGSALAFSRLDRLMLTWLTRHADPSLLAQIENAPLPRQYFGDMVLALQSCFVYDDVALCLLPRAQGPDIIGEVADLLIRCEGIERVLCGAVCGDRVLLSVRTDKRGGNATQLLRTMLEGIGRGGGHAHRAGGKLMSSVSGPRVPDELQDELRTRWLKVCGVQRSRGTRLIAKRDIVGNLG